MVILSGAEGGGEGPGSRDCKGASARTRLWVSALEVLARRQWMPAIASFTFNFSFLSRESVAMSGKGR